MGFCSQEGLGLGQQWSEEIKLDVELGSLQRPAPGGCVLVKHSIGDGCIKALYFIVM